MRQSQSLQLCTGSQLAQLAGRDLPGAGIDARTLDCQLRATAQRDAHRVRRNRHDSTRRCIRSGGLQRRVVQAYAFAIQLGIRTWLRVTPANQVEDVSRGLGEINFGMFIPARWFVGRPALVLHQRGRFARFDQVDRLDHRFYPQREELVEVDRAGRVALGYGDAFLDQDGSRVDSCIGPEPGDAGLDIALDDGPVYRACAATSRQ